MERKQSYNIVACSRTFVMSAICVTLFVSTHSALAAPPTYLITDLGDVAGGNNISDAFGINDHGDIVGDCNDGSGWQVACFWRYDATSDSHTIINLADIPGARDSQAVAINNNKEIAGYINVVSGSKAISWDGALPLPTLTNLDSLPSDTWDIASAFDINDSGTVVGDSTTGQGTWATEWVLSSPSSPLSLSTGIIPLVGSSARGINSNNERVGIVNIPGGRPQAAYWDTNGTLTHLPLFFRSGNERGASYDINNLGQIVGVSTLDNGPNHAALWYGGLIHDLGDLATSGASSSQALAVNNSGYIVGAALRGGGNKGALWVNGQIYELNDLIDPSDPYYGSNFSISVARDINENGWIVGVAYFPGGIGTHGVLLRPAQPIQNPFPDGDVAPLGSPDGQVNGADVLIAVRIALGNIPAGALELLHGDMNLDGVMDISDLLAIAQLAMN